MNKDAVIWVCIGILIALVYLCVKVDETNKILTKEQTGEYLHSSEQTDQYLHRSWNGGWNGE